MRVISFKEDVDLRQVTFTIQLDHQEHHNFDVREFNPIDIVRTIKGGCNPKAIQEIIYDYFKLPQALQDKMKDAKECGRFGHLVKVRRLCYYFIRTYTEMTLEKIGDLYGQDHATVIHHCKYVKHKLGKNSDEYLTLVDDIDRIIHAQLNEEKCQTS